MSGRAVTKSTSDETVRLDFARFKAVLALRRLTQRTVAARAGIPEGDLSRFIRRALPIRLEVAEAIAGGLDCELGDIVSPSVPS